MEIKIGDLVGKKVKRIFMNEDELKFETDSGSFIFTVFGDCCSHSYFHDFIGVKKLLGRVVKAVETVDMEDPQAGNGCDSDCIQAYGIRFITEDPEFGEVSSVMSFRNNSNGYYGGSLNSGEESDKEVSPEIFKDHYTA